MEAGDFGNKYGFIFLDCMPDSEEEDGLAGVSIQSIN